jgi:twitching motility protein PilU
LSDLASGLKAIVSQRLLQNNVGGRVPAVEVLLNTQLVAEMITRGDFNDVKEALQKSMSPGSQTFEQDIARLIREGLVSREEGLRYADSPTDLMWRLQNDTTIPTRPTAKSEDHDDGPTFTEITLDVHTQDDSHAHFPGPR